MEQAEEIARQRRTWFDKLKMTEIHPSGISSMFVAELAKHLQQNFGKCHGRQKETQQYFPNKAQIEAAEFIWKQFPDFLVWQESGDLPDC